MSFLNAGVVIYYVTYIQPQSFGGSTDVIIADNDEELQGVRVFLFSIESVEPPIVAIDETTFSVELQDDEGNVSTPSMFACTYVINNTCTMQMQLLD